MFYLSPEFCAKKNKEINKFLLADQFEDFHNNYLLQTDKLDRALYAISIMAVILPHKAKFVFDKSHVYGQRHFTSF